jgi:hypothetical protein
MGYSNIIQFDGQSDNWRNDREYRTMGWNGQYQGQNYSQRNAYSMNQGLPMGGNVGDQGSRTQWPEGTTIVSENMMGKFMFVPNQQLMERGRPPIGKPFWED